MTSCQLMTIECFVFEGGMKATVWNDAIQMIIVGVCVLLLAILGVIDLGGPAKVWEIAKNDGRLNIK